MAAAEVAAGMAESGAAPAGVGLEALGVQMPSVAAAPMEAAVPAEANDGWGTLRG